MSTHTARRDGFTLVELAIVLVIVGILIGGILVAQSMISTSKITATIQQIGRFDAGVENFKTKYGYLPGDAPMFGGDGDGVIDTTTANYGYADTNNVFMCEIANFWNNIDPAQYPGSSSCVLPGAQAMTSGASKNVPLAKLGKVNSFFIANALGTLAIDGQIDMVNPRNFYVLLDSSQAQSTVPTGDYFFNPTDSTNSAAKPAELLALDTKIDDGIGNTGNVLSGSIGAYRGISPTPLGTCSSSTTGIYAVENNTYECTPLIRLGSQTGDPQ